MTDQTQLVATDETQADLEADMQRAYNAARQVKRFHKSLTVATEGRVAAERELQNAVAAEKAASERLAQAVSTFAKSMEKSP